MGTSKTVVVISEDLVDGLQLEEIIGEAGAPARIFVAQSQELPQMFERTLPDIVVLDVRFGERAVRMATHCLGRDDLGSGPEVLVVAAAGERRTLGWGWTVTPVRELATVMRAWLGTPRRRAISTWPEDH